MADLINWLNDNQGFVMILLTCVYVIATIIIVIYNRKSIKEMERGREEENRPYIFVNLHKDPRDHCFYLRVKNYGKTGGKISNISIAPNLKFEKEGKIEDFLKNVILAPGQILQFIILENYKETSKNNYDVLIDYISTYDEKKFFKEEYNLIIQYSSQMGYSNNTKSTLSDRDNAINNIANHLDSIRNKL